MRQPHASTPSTPPPTGPAGPPAARAIARTRLAWALLPLLLLAPLSRADEAPPGALGIGDRIGLKVNDREELDGPYRVRPPGVVSIPGVGEVAVAGMTPAEAERAVARRLAETLGVIDPKVSLEVEEYRPVFVLGHVRNPGRYAYEPGMAAMHAIAIAGGYRTAEQINVFARSELSRAREKLALLQKALARAMIRRARLLAERDEQESFAVPDEAGRYMAEEQIREAVANERGIMVARREAMAGQLELMEEQMGHFRDEIVALKEKLVSVDEQQQLLVQEIGKMKPLEDRGLVSTRRMLELRRERVALEGDRRETLAFIARAETGSVGVHRGMRTIREDRRQEVLALISGTEDEMARHRVSLTETAKLIADLDGSDPRTVLAADPDGDAKLRVWRDTGDGLEERVISATDRLRPGDVLRVPRSRAPVAR